jgi:hypothetical protein
MHHHQGSPYASAIQRRGDHVIKPPPPHRNRARTNPNLLIDWRNTVLRIGDG